MLQGQIYVPLLYTKGAELKALKRLETITKSNTFPVIAIRPSNHNDFSDSLDIIKDSVGDLRVGLELDRHKFNKCKKIPARDQFDSLFDPSNGYKNYYTLCADWKNAVPVLRSSNGIFDHLDQQIAHITSLDRGIIIRVERDYVRDFSSLVNSGTLNDLDLMFLVDATWSDDILQAEGWCQTMVSQIFTAYPDKDIACISSSYPKDFSKIKGRGVFTNDDRELFDRIRRQHNQARLTYGDWASTRPSEERITQQPRPRIDLPTPREWISFRLEDKEKGGFTTVAKRATNDRSWFETPDCWGKRMVDLTALDLPGKIDSNHKANYARIHLHMTIQAMGGIITDLPDEPYVDEF